MSAPRYLPITVDHVTACDDRRLVHAVTVDQTFGRHKATKAAELVTVCGAPVHAPYGATLIRGDETGVCVMPWPPPVAAIAPDYKRCLACHQDTGRKRPDPMWANLQYVDVVA